MHLGRMFVKTEARGADLDAIYKIIKKRIKWMKVAKSVKNKEDV